MSIRTTQWQVSLSLIAASLALVTGCATLDDPNVPEPIRSHLEPSFQTDYLLYRPSAYDRRAAWPLVVVCHGRFPDSAQRQIRDWTQLAERFGFIVAAPNFNTSRSGARPRPDTDREHLEHDLDRILAIVQHIRAAQTISNDRVFIHGVGHGGRIALFAGLAEPGTFRAVCACDLKFDESWFASPEVRIDPYQPVLIQHSPPGLFGGKDAECCIDWLRAQHSDVQTESTSSHRDADAERVVEFYESVIRSKPWVRIQVLANDDNDPMVLRFSLSGTHQPKNYQWDFGDGDTSTVAEPIHRFAKTGVYRTKLTLDGPNGESLTRFKDVSVPHMIVESLSARP